MGKSLKVANVPNSPAFKAYTVSGVVATLSGCLVRPA